MNSINIKNLSQDHLHLFHKWLNDYDASGPYDGTHPCTFDQVKEVFDRGEYKMVRMFYLDNQPIGWGEIVGEGVEVRLSVQISKPNYRGKSLGEIMHRLLIEDFKSTNVNALYIVAWTHVDNIPERKILEKLGFVLFPDENKMFDINGGMEEFCLYEYKITS